MPLLPNPLPGAQNDKQKLFDHHMGCFLNPNHLRLLISLIFCLFRVHLLYSLKLSFPAMTLRTFFEGSCDPEADLQCQLACLKKSTKVAHLLQYRTDLVLLLLALESSPVNSVWHERNIFMSLLSVASQHWQRGREVWERAWFLNMLQGRLRASTEKYRVCRQHKNPSQSTDLDLRGDKHNHPGSAVCYPMARATPTGKCTDGYKE